MGGAAGNSFNVGFLVDNYLGVGLLHYTKIRLYNGDKRGPEYGYHWKLIGVHPLTTRSEVVSRV